MDPNTHEVLLELPGGVRAFITGVPDKCEHKWNDSVLFARSGKTITWKTYPKWASFTSKFREQLVREHHEKTDDPYHWGCSCVF